MGCKVTMSVISEHQEGRIGDDWKYTITVKAFNEGLKGMGAIDVPKHTLPEDTTQDPPGPPTPVDIPSGECGKELMLRIHVFATEVDFFKSDSGEHTIDYRLQCPGPDADPVKHETEISVGVRESPGFVENAAILTIKLRFEAVCE